MQRHSVHVALASALCFVFLSTYASATTLQPDQELAQSESNEELAATPLLSFQTDAVPTFALPSIHRVNLDTSEHVPKDLALDYGLSHAPRFSSLTRTFKKHHQKRTSARRVSTTVHRGNTTTVSMMEIIKRPQGLLAKIKRWWKGAATTRPGLKELPSDDATERRLKDKEIEWVKSRDRTKPVVVEKHKIYNIVELARADVPLGSIMSKVLGARVYHSGLLHLSFNIADRTTTITQYCNHGSCPIGDGLKRFHINHFIRTEESNAVVCDDLPWNDGKAAVPPVAADAPTPATPAAKDNNDATNTKDPTPNNTDAAKGAEPLPAPKADNHAKGDQNNPTPEKGDKDKDKDTDAKSPYKLSAAEKQPLPPEPPTPAEKVKVKTNAYGIHVCGSDTLAAYESLLEFEFKTGDGKTSASGRVMAPKYTEEKIFKICNTVEPSAWQRWKNTDEAKDRVHWAEFLDAISDEFVFDINTELPQITSLEMLGNVFTAMKKFLNDNDSIKNTFTSLDFRNEKDVAIVLKAIPQEARNSVLAKAAKRTSEKKKTTFFLFQALCMAREKLIDPDNYWMCEKAFDKELKTLHEVQESNRKWHLNRKDRAGEGEERKKRLEKMEAAMKPFREAHLFAWRYLDPLRLISVYDEED